MKLAYVGIREQPHYRREAFVAGLKAAGYEVRIGAPQRFDADTIYLCWNRYSENHEYCRRLEQAGGICLIAENGYLRGPKDGGDYYALARHGHNGSGTWPEGDASRFEALGIELQPWREQGQHILVCPNRSFGMPGMIMPPEWAHDVKKRLTKFTKREIRVRPHPGNDAPKKPLADDLRDAWAVVIWASSAGVHALVAGIPVICESPHWICKKAASTLASIESPTMFGRTVELQRLAWAQWNLAEIASGEAIDHLLRAA